MYQLYFYNLTAKEQGEMVLRGVENITKLGKKVFSVITQTKKLADELAKEEKYITEDQAKEYLGGEIKYKYFEPKK